MSFQLVEYESLKQGVFQSIASCIEGHTHEKMDAGERTVDSLRKALVSVDDSHIDRKTQIEVLLTVVSILDTMNATHPLFSQKEAILNGAAYYTCYQIDKSYNAGVAGYVNAAVTAPKESKLRTGLHNALGITKKDTPDDRAISIMFTAFKELLEHNIFIDGDVKKGCLEESKQTFLPIQQFSIMPTIDSLSRKIEKVDRHLRSAAEKTFEDSKRPATQTGAGWLGFLGIKSTHSKKSATSQKAAATVIGAENEEEKDGAEQLGGPSSLTLG